MKSVFLAFAMFSRIPMPRVAWDEKNMRYMMAAFPLVGVAVGGAVVVWNMICVFLSLGVFLKGAGIALLPLLVTGGIHMDGFCDTVDALASHGDVEKKRAILKDPHVGSFAAVAACAYILLFFALGAEAGFSSRQLVCFGLSFVLSRVMGAWSVLRFPCSSASSLGRGFQSAAEKKKVLVILLALGVVVGGAMVWLGGIAGAAAVGVAVLLLRWCRRVARREFDGMSGDLSGWLLQLCEVVSLACLVIVPRIVAVL